MLTLLLSAPLNLSSEPPNWACLKIGFTPSMLSSLRFLLVALVLPCVCASIEARNAAAEAALTSAALTASDDSTASDSTASAPCPSGYSDCSGECCSDDGEMSAVRRVQPNDCAPVQLWSEPLGSLV